MTKCEEKLFHTSVEFSMLSVLSVLSALSTLSALLVSSVLVSFSELSLLSCTVLHCQCQVHCLVFSWHCLTLQNEYFSTSLLDKICEIWSTLGILAVTDSAGSKIVHRYVVRNTYRAPVGDQKWVSEFKDNTSMKNQSLLP